MALRKVCMVLVLAVFLVTPAFALESELSGFYNVRGIADNFSASNNYIGTFDDDARTESLVDQRLRLKLDSIVNEYLSFVYYVEVDMQWGDESYSNAGRNDGGAIGGDTTNLESKNAYINVKIPSYDSEVRVGLQGFEDHYDWTFVGADMAGVKYSGDFGAVDLTAGWFKLIENDFEHTDDVTLWALQTEYSLSPNFNIGADYYYYMNQGSREYATFFGTTDIEAVLDNVGTWTANREDMDLHYVGGHAEYRLSNVVFSGWVNVNVGSVEEINNNIGAPLVTEDMDVRGYSARVDATGFVSGFDWRVGATYFSGDDDLTDGDADFVINPLATESFAYADDGFMIFTPDIAWNSVGQYGVAMVDAAWAGYGLASVVLTGGYTPPQMENFNVKGGIGYFSSLEDTLAENDPRTDRAGKQLGTEIFLRAGYQFAENLDVSINGAYAFLGDFYDNHGGGTAINQEVDDIDDPYEVYLKATLTF